MSGRRSSSHSELGSRRTRVSKLHSKEAAEMFRNAQSIWRHGEEASSDVRQKALEKYTQAAQSGIAEYEIALGQILCDEDHPDTANFEEGFNWILNAAMHGDPGAQYWIARELATGENVRRDPSLTAYWYRRAARRGLAAAKYNLGIMYLEGDGVPANKARGRQWVHRAAEGGEVLAIMILADSYMTGEMGFPVDESKATNWRAKLDSNDSRPN